MEYKAGVKIDTGESQATIKQLKKQVQELTALMGKLETGTYEYDKVCTELVDVQTQLTTAMKAGKSQLSAQDGSYNALVNRMKALKDVMKATTDEAKRNQLSVEINEINNVLKEMDAAQGVHSRNVGNYTESVVNAYQQIRKEIKQYQSEVLSAEEGTEEYEQAMNRLSQAQFAMRDMNEKARYAVADFGEQLANVTGIASGLMSGFSAVQGAMVLCGADTENFEKTMIKLQSAMAIVQGLQGLEGINDRIVGLTKTIKIAAKAMGATGWLAVIVTVSTALVGLVSWIKKTKKETDTLSKDMATMAENAIEVAGGLGEEIAKLKIYQSVAEDVTQSMEKRNSAATEGLRLLGEEITETNIAAFKNGEYADKINAVTIALINKAKVEGAYNIIKEKYNQALQKQLELEEQARKAKEEEIKLREQQKNNQTTTKQEVAAFGFNMMANDPMTGNYGGSSEVTTAEDVRDADIEIWERRANDYSNAAKQVIVDADNEVKDFINNLTKDGIDFSSLLGGTKPTGVKDEDKEKTLDEILEEIQQQLYEDIINMVIEDIPIDITDSGSKSVGYQYKDGDAEKRYGFWNNIIDDETSNAVRRSKLDGGTPEEQDALIIEGEERKLAKLKEFWEQARNEGDVTGELALRQQIAEQELTIEEEKNRAILESEERTKEKRLEIMNEISNALSVAGSVTQGILEITQAAAEKDGKISENEAKRIKGLQYATATINMLQGAVSAFSAAQSIPPPFGQIIGAANAAAVIAMGTVNLMKIKNTDITGEVSSSSTPSVGASVTPSPSTYTSELPATYTRQLTGASEIEELNKEQRVYILESDIQQSNKRVEIRQNESSF